MANSPVLNLPLIAEGQASAHIPHNVAVNILDALAFPVFIDRDLNSPPGAPANSDTYLVGASPTGGWSGQANKIAVYSSGWYFYTPFEGMLFYVEDENIHIVYNGSSWDTVPTKSYVDNLVAGVKWKASVRVATTTSGTLATAFENGDTVDGVVLATGDRILIKNQSSATENGIYVVAASGAPTRATDADSSAELIGCAVIVEEGTANADKAFICTNNATITIGATNITFVAFASSIGALVAANNLSDIPNAATARTNLGAAPTSAGDRNVQICVTDPNGDALTTGDGKAYLFIPTVLNGMNLVGVSAAVSTQSTSGTPVNVQINNVTDAVDMLSTALTIDNNESTSVTAATPAVIDTSKDDVVTGDILRIDVDAAGSGAKGLIVNLVFQTP